MMYENIVEKYQRCVGPSEFGGTAEMGSALASHFLRSVMDRACSRRWSIFILFIGLTEAFDKVLRELVVGWPDGLPRTEQASHLEAVGLDSKFVENIVHLVESERPVLKQAGIDMRVAELLRSVPRHTYTLFCCLLSRLFLYRSKSDTFFFFAVFRSPTLYI